MNFLYETDDRWRKMRNTFCSVCTRTCDIYHVSINHCCSVFAELPNTVAQRVFIRFHDASSFCGFILLTHNFPQEQKTSSTSSGWHADPRKYLSLRENRRLAWAVVGQRFIVSVRRTWVTFHIALINCAKPERGSINCDLWSSETTSSLIADHRVTPAHRYVLCNDWFCANGFAII